MKLLELAQREAENLIRICNPQELGRINFERLDGNSTDWDCLYGQLTGHPDTFRAIELICKSASHVICNDIDNDGKIVPVSKLHTFRDNYRDGIFVTDDGKIIDYKQRSLHFISPLEAFTPTLDHPEREERIMQLKQWLRPVYKMA